MTPQFYSSRKNKLTVCHTVRIKQLTHRRVDEDRYFPVEQERPEKRMNIVLTFSQAGGQRLQMNDNSAALFCNMFAILT